jgi:hypothetical protein
LIVIACLRCAFPGDGDDSAGPFGDAIGPKPNPACADGYPVSPTIFRQDGFRFFFFSREEPRMHVHVHCADGEAKYWLEPVIKLAQNYRLSDRQLRSIEELIREHESEIHTAWKAHFGR